MFNRNQTRMERCKNGDSVAMTLHCRREEGGLEADRGAGTERLSAEELEVVEHYHKSTMTKKRHLQVTAVSAGLC